MSRPRAAAIALALIAGAPGARTAAGADCAVTAMRVSVNSSGLAGGVLEVPGLVLPVAVDEAAGTLVFDFSAFPLTSFVIVGVLNDLAIPGSPVGGTLDGAGNVTLGPVPMALTTHFGGQSTSLDAAPVLTSGIAAVSVSDADFESEGEPLDFTTGTLRLQGEALITDAPGAGGPISTGLDIACTLSPLPSRDALPAGPRLARARGRARTGTDPAAGDRLTLSAAFVQGARAVDAAAEELFVRVRGAAGTALLVRVPAGALTARGRTLALVDDDGSRLRVLAGARPGAPTGGTLRLRRTRKGYKLALALRGADLSALDGPARVTLDVGPLAASDDVTATRKGTRLTLR